MAKTRIFISYSRQDRRFVDRLRVHLKPLERQGVIDAWDDSRIRAGTNWKDEIRRALNDASVAVLLVSADFYASEFVATDELPPLLTRAASDGTVILPIIVGHCRFQDDIELSKYQAVNNPSRPLATLSPAERDKVLLDLSRRIEALHKEQADQGGEIDTRLIAPVSAVPSSQTEPSIDQPTVPPTITVSDDLAQRLLAATSGARTAIERRELWNRQANDVLVRLTRLVVVDIGDQLRRRGFEPFFANRPTVIEQFFPKAVPLGRHIPDRLLKEARGMTLQAPGESGVTTLLYADIMVTLFDNGTIELDAQYVTAQIIPPADRLISPEQFGVASRSAVLGSHHLESAIQDIEESLLKHLDTALDNFVQRAGGGVHPLQAEIPGLGQAQRQLAPTSDAVLVDNRRALRLSYVVEEKVAEPNAPEYQVVSLRLANDAEQTTSNYRFDIELPFMPPNLTDPLNPKRRRPPITPILATEQAGNGFLRWRAYRSGDRLFLAFRSDGQAPIWSGASEIMCQFWLVAAWYGLHTGSEVTVRPKLYECDAQIQVEGAPPRKVKVPFDFYELIPGLY